MLVQMPLSHTSPASHSSTSAGYGVGVGVREPGWRQCRRPLLSFPTPSLGLEIRAEASRAQEKHPTPKWTLTHSQVGYGALGPRPGAAKDPGPDSKKRGPSSPLLILAKQEASFCIPSSHTALGFLLLLLYPSSTFHGPLLPMSVMLPVCLSFSQ